MQNSIVALQPSDIANVSGGITTMSTAITVASFGVMAATIGLYAAGVVSVGIFVTGITTGISSYSTFSDLKKASQATEAKIVQLMLFADAAIMFSRLFNFNLNAGVNGFLNHR